MPSPPQVRPDASSFKVSTIAQLKDEGLRAEPSANPA